MLNNTRLSVENYLAIQESPFTFLSSISKESSTGEMLDNPKWKIKRIYDGVEAESRKSQASFQIIKVSSEGLPVSFIDEGFIVV